MINLANYPNPLMNSPKRVITGFNADGYERFMPENFKIIDKKQNPVPFDPNPAQHSLNKFLEMFYDILVLKARKMGFSSDALAIGATKFITGRNEKCVSMSFEQGAAEKQLARAKYYIKSYEEKNGIKVPFKYNTKNSMVWEGKYETDRGTVEHFQNVLQVGSAGNTAFGRGDDITFLHLTEVSLVDVYELMAGVGEACLPHAHKILETTAAGFNTYKKYWDESMMDITGFACLFYSPLWEYSEAYVQDKRNKLGRLGMQEYPMTPEEAFVTSGDGYFDNMALYKILENVKAWEANHRHELQTV
jgi:hypothetical protein